MNFNIIIKKTDFVNTEICFILAFFLNQYFICIKKRLKNLNIKKLKNIINIIKKIKYHNIIFSKKLNKLKRYMKSIIISNKYNISFL